MMKYVTQRNVIYFAIAAVLVIIGVTWWRARNRVLDPSNDSTLSNLFDQLNPGVKGTASNPIVSDPVVVDHFPVLGALS